MIWHRLHENTRCQGAYLLSNKYNTNVCIVDVSLDFMFCGAPTKMYILVNDTSAFIWSISKKDKVFLQLSNFWLSNIPKPINKLL